MRQIKFRGKDDVTGEWFYGNLFVEDTNGRTHVGTPRRMCLRVYPDTVGQFTGLLDKNGKEIYEGDIVRYYDDIEDELISAPVIYHADTCSFCVQPQSSDPVGITAFWQFEVIGNIYDNPSLLKGGADGAN